MVVITAVIAGSLVLVYRILCSMENRRRDKTGTVEGFEHAYEDDLTDKMVSNPCSSLLSFINRPAEYAIPVFIVRERRSAGWRVVWGNSKYNN